MKKYPFIKQKELKDCGVSCLLMIIKYYKGYIPINELIEMTNTNKNGVTAYNLVESAKKIGFNSYGIKTHDLCGDIILPCIAHVVIEDTYNHFVVIYKIDKVKKEVLIADPAFGIKKITLEEFYKIFNNIIIILYPLKKIPYIKNNTSLVNCIKNILIKYKKDIFHLFVMSSLITLFTVLVSFYIEYMMNNMNKLKEGFILFIIIYLIKNIIDYFKNNKMINLSSNLEKSFMNEYLSKIISLPYKYFKNRTTGEVVTCINDLRNINDLVIKLIMLLIIDLPLSIVTSLILFKISHILFLITFLVLTIYVFVVLLFNKKIKNNLSILKEKYSILNKNIVEKISGYETIKGLGIENEVISSLKLENNNYIESNKKLFGICSIENFFKTLTYEIGGVILIFIGFIFVKKNFISIGTLISYNTLLIYFLNPIKNILDTNKDLKDMIISYKRINDLIIIEKDNNDIKNLEFNNIKIKSLDYSYDNKQDLKNINIEIDRNEKIMFIGKSGSGKSTIFKLLKKYYKVSNNKIFINDIDINKINKKEIDNNITYVSQNEILFSDTLKNNLVLNRKVDDEKLNELIDDTYIKYDSNLKLNTLVLENGLNFSGGEKSRIILARSLLNNSKIILLDEVLNQVDIKLERKILKNILLKYSDKIIIYVSHRYDNIDLFDRVINLEEGKIKYRKDISKLPGKEILC